MMYGKEICGGTYDTDLLKLERIHINGMRLTTGATARSNIAMLYADTGFNDIKTICNIAMLTMMHKIKHHNSPVYLQRLLPSTVQQVAPYNLRNKDDFDVPHHCTESYKRSFICASSYLWNTLPLETRNMQSLITFKDKIRRAKWANQILLYWTTLARGSSCSYLNRLQSTKRRLHLNLHVAADSKCECGAVREDAEHFFLHCPLYNDKRTEMCATISDVSKFDISALLHGDKTLNIDKIILYLVQSTNTLKTQKEPFLTVLLLLAKRLYIVSCILCLIGNKICLNQLTKIPWEKN